MSYKTTIEKYEKQIGKKFSYAEAFEFWNALEEPYKLQIQFHLACNEVFHNPKDEKCVTESRLIGEVDKSKIMAKSFFNKTLNNKALFPEDDKNRLLKAVATTNLFQKIKSDIMAGGYYEKYLKYKNKYLMLKAQLGGESTADMLKKYKEQVESGNKSNDIVLALIERKKNPKPSGDLEVHKWVNLTAGEDFQVFFPSQEPQRSITNRLIEELKKDLLAEGISTVLSNENNIKIYLRALQAYLAYNHGGCFGVNNGKASTVFEAQETCNKRMQDLTKPIFNLKLKLSFKDMLVKKLKDATLKSESVVKNLIRTETDNFEEYIGKL